MHDLRADDSRGPMARRLCEGAALRFGCSLYALRSSDQGEARDRSE